MARHQLLLVSVVALLNGSCAEDRPQQRLETTLDDHDSFDKLRLEIAFLTKTISQLNEEVDSLKKADRNLQEDLLNSVPLGAILPWINKPTQDSLHQEDLPLGFALCDGSLITEGIWAGELTPDLTTTGKFLRGGNPSQILDMEESMIQDHVHIDLGHSHTDAGHTHADSGHTHPYYDSSRASSDSDGTANGGTIFKNGNDKQWYGWDRITDTSYAAIQTSYASIGNSTSGMSGVSTDSGIKAGEEVRPTNMRVLFIVKVASVEA